MPRIRPYRPADWQDFFALDLATVRGSLRGQTPEEAKKFHDRWEQRVRTIYKWGDTGPTTSNSRLLVLESDDGEYAGHIWVCDQDDFFSGETKLFVVAVALGKKFRGKGWSKILMQHAKSEAEARGLKRISLGVDAENEVAISLYKREGFVTKRMTMEIKL